MNLTSLNEALCPSASRCKGVEFMFQEKKAFSVYLAVIDVARLVKLSPTAESLKKGLASGGSKTGKGRRYQTKILKGFVKVGEDNKKYL